MSKFLIPLTVLVLGSTALPQPSIQKRAACAGNTADTRDQWCDFDINTDYYNTIPDTGVTRTYTLNLATATAAPDGVEMEVMVANGQFPGPLIEADWGDYVEVVINNEIATNGTSIHFHGLHQKNTTQQDGVASITQCPLAPGASQTYLWRATQYGSSWWHSHFSMQAWNGVVGPLTIHGPASANYDEDLGTILLSDWSHITADQQQSIANEDPTFSQANGLINGTNVFEAEDGTVGERFETVFEAGKSYRIRLVNTAVDSFFTFSIDSHEFTVIAADFVPITPYQTDRIHITMGQRYDIIVEANQGSGDFWMRAIPMTCSTHDNPQNIRGIVRYDAASTATPTNSTTMAQVVCQDEDASKLVPIFSWDVGAADISADLPASAYINETDGWFRWQVGNTTLLTDWANPTIEAISEGDFDFATQEAVITAPNANEWVYLVITQTSTFNPAHPIHLHGHDFHILAQGTGTYDASEVTLNLENPMRRDVANLPGPSGYLVIAFYTDNPGIWLMHCHIGYHTFEGFGLQFVERQDEIISRGLIDSTALAEVCDAWDSYASADALVQHESGI